MTNIMAHIYEIFHPFSLTIGPLGMTCYNKNTILKGGGGESMKGYAAIFNTKIPCLPNILVSSMCVLGTAIAEAKAQ